jgi:hypothetical protein
MRLSEVTRRTSGKAVLEALYDTDACAKALIWCREEVDTHPRITAQGLWHACPYGEWLVWLVERIWSEVPEQNLRAYWSEMTKLDEEIAPFSTRSARACRQAEESARAIRAAFESIWL